MASCMLFGRNFTTMNLLFFALVVLHVKQVLYMSDVLTNLNFTCFLWACILTFILYYALTSSLWIPCLLLIVRITLLFKTSVFVLLTIHLMTNLQMYWGSISILSPVKVVANPCVDSAIKWVMKPITVGLFSRVLTATKWAT